MCAPSWSPRCPRSRPGEPFWVGLRQTIKPHWHTYWKNPGDSGLPTEITWTLPAGAKADPIVWPAPTLIDVSGVINYGFQDDILLLVKITPPADLAGHAGAQRPTPTGWCATTSASPRKASSRSTCRSGRPPSRPMPHTRALFDKARRVVPTESPWPARFGLAKSGDPTLVVEAKGLKPDTIRDVYFFPAEWGPVASMAKQTASVTADGHPHPAQEGRRQGAPRRSRSPARWC